MGVKLMDAGPNLLDLRFAEDVLLFTEARVETGGLLGALVKQLDRLGLLFDPEKTTVITDKAQIPDITAKAGVIVQVLPRDGGQKWLGSVLTSRGS